MIISMLGTIISGIIVSVFLGFCIDIYNRLVFLKNNIDKAWANIDILLKQRHDEIPNLVEVCKGYMKHEREVFENITRLRINAIESNSVNEKLHIEEQLGASLGRFLGVVENYPELKANQNFLNLQNRISYTEEQIADRREIYNDSVTIFNTRIQQVPYNIVADFIKYKQQSLFRISEQERKLFKIKI